MLEKFHVAKEDIIHIEEERLRSVTKEILMTRLKKTLELHFPRP